MRTKHLFALAILFTGFCATAQVTKEPKRTAENSKAHAVPQVNLEEYKGHYASKEDSYGIVIYTEGDKLHGKLPGQPSIVFEHTGNKTFKSEKSGVIIIFNTDKSQLSLQRKEGTVVLFKK